MLTPTWTYINSDFYVSWKETLITAENQKRLNAYSILKTYSDNSYVQDVTNSNFLRIKERFFNNSEENTYLLNVGSWLFTAISTTIWYYFDEPDMDIETGWLYDAVMDYVALWFCVLWIERIGWEEKIIRLSAYNYIKDNWKHKIVTQYQQLKDNGQTYYYLLEQIYSIWYIENKLYKLRGNSDFSEAKQVELTELEETRWMSPIIETWLESEWIYIIWDLHQSSIFNKVTNLVYSIDRKIVMFETQFLQNVESYVLFSWITFSDEEISSWKLDIKNKRHIAVEDPAADIKFVENTNQLVKTAIDYNNTQIRQVSSITKIPLRFLWVDEVDGSSGRNARLITQWAFIKYIEWLRDTFTITFIQILKDLGKNETVNFTDVIIKDSLELAEELSVARASQLISRFKAIKEYQKINSEDAKVEEELIRKDIEESWEPEIEKKTSFKEKLNPLIKKGSQEGEFDKS